MKYLYLISIFLAFNLKNLSAYQEITIQKDSNLQNYQELLLRINNSITEEDIISSIEKNIYNINFSNTQISLNVDIDNLSKELYAKNINHNLFRSLFDPGTIKIESSMLNPPHTNFELIWFRESRVSIILLFDSCLLGLVRGR